MIPMGTIITVCMFAGRAMLVPPVLKKSPPMLRNLVASIVLVAGLWNVLWYGLQHYLEFWGVAALLSGLILILTALYIFNVSWMPSILHRVKPLVLLLLLSFAMLYAIRIATL